MSLAELPSALADAPGNRDALRRAAGFARGAGVTPFVGAGLSAAFGMPTWKNFLLETADENGLGAEIAAEVETGAYEAAAQRLLEELGAHAFHRRIEAVFGDHAIREAAFDEAAVTIVPALARGPVVTLNYDRVLERAFARARRPS